MKDSSSFQFFFITNNAMINILIRKTQLGISDYLFSVDPMNVLNAIGIHPVLKNYFFLPCPVPQGLGGNFQKCI